MKNNQKKKESDLRYLQLLSQTFPTIADASTEIINLQAILNLPRVLNTFWPTCTESTSRSSMY